MPSSNPTGSKIIDDLVAKFPDAPALTLAKKAFREHPEVWSSLDAVRSAIRNRFGVHGKHNRAFLNKAHHREPRKAGWSDVIPEALVELKDWKPLVVNGPHRALILSDCHIPFHAPDALELALQYGFNRKATMIVLNGDIMDHFAISRWQNDPKLRDFPAEVRAGKQFLTGLRQRFPKARILFHMGNHEERFVHYMRLKAPDLLGLPEFEWESIFDLAGNEIEMVGDKRPIRLGSLNVLHGHEHRQGISQPVSPARGLFLRAKCHAICGHWHQPSQHSETNVEQKVITTWSTGCLCSLRPAYAPLNSWAHGFAYVELTKDGGFRVENKRIIDGAVW